MTCWRNAAEVIRQAFNSLRRGSATRIRSRSLQISAMRNRIYSVGERHAILQTTDLRLTQCRSVDSPAPPTPVLSLPRADARGRIDHSCSIGHGLVAYTEAAGLLRDRTERTFSTSLARQMHRLSATAARRRAMRSSSSFLMTNLMCACF